MFLISYDITQLYDIYDSYDISLLLTLCTFEPFFFFFTYLTNSFPLIKNDCPTNNQLSNLIQKKWVSKFETNIKISSWEYLATYVSSRKVFYQSCVISI